MTKDINKSAIVRQFKDGDSIILFPCEYAAGYNVMSYMTICQHGGADYKHIISTTQPHKDGQKILD